jgi:hypothetical protein
VMRMAKRVTETAFRDEKLPVPDRTKPQDSGGTVLGIR